MAHEPETLPIIEKVLDKLKPQMMIELGTFVGGLTMFLHEYDREILLYTFDKFPMEVLWKRGEVSGGLNQLAVMRRRIFNPNAVFINTDVVSGKRPILVNLLEQPVPKFLYCDNGNKTKEVILYAPHLQPGDIIGIHDVGTEIDLTNGLVQVALKDFEPLSCNTWLEEEGLLTRMFRRSDG